MDFVSFILNLDRRVIYTIVALCIAIPLIKPLKLPLVPTPEVEGIFNAIEALEPGTNICIAGDYDPASKPELQPMMDAVLAHCFCKGLKPHILTLWPGGPALLQQAVERQATRFNKQSGVDYAYLGYKAGNFAVVIGMANGITDTFSTDFYGKPTSSMQIYQQAKSLNQFGYILDIAAGATVETWLAYGAGPTKVPMGASCTAVSAAGYYPYLQANQLTGLAGGMKGTAEYEKLLLTKYGKGGEGWQAVSTALNDPEFDIPPGDATKGMDAQSAVHIFIVLSIILANICYFIAAKREREERRKA
jgi:hypothetical protein